VIDFKSKKVLILAPHTDDGELGCGATIAHILECGAEVFYTAFSVCEQSVPLGYEKNELELELLEATKSLGIPESHVFTHRYEVRRMPEHRQEILQDIIDKKNEVSPDIVFLPCLQDIHQDHQVISREGLRAYKDRTILSYELPWNNLAVSTSAFVRVEQRHVEAKIAALKCYRTQALRPYFQPEFVRSLARTRGVQIGVEYAEAFELVRLVI